MEPMLAHSAAATIGGKMLTWHDENCVMSCRDCIPRVTPLLLVMAKHACNSTTQQRQHCSLHLDPTPAYSAPAAVGS